MSFFKSVDEVAMTYAIYEYVYTCSESEWFGWHVAATVLLDTSCTSINLYVVLASFMHNEQFIMVVYRTYN